MKKNYIFLIFSVFLFFVAGSKQAKASHGYIQPPTDTIMLNEFDSIPGKPYAFTYPYTNGHGYFFGTNYLNLDQDPNTPHQDGILAFAQGYEGDTSGYKILEILCLVGHKQKQSDFGTPLIVSLHLLDDSSTYDVGNTSYTVAKPGTKLSSTSVPWDDIVVSPLVDREFTVATLPMPVEVDQDYAVVIDLYDFYVNDDEIGFMASNNGGASGIFGKEKCLWLYPKPMVWIQVSHVYTSSDRAIGIFPVIDDGTFGIEEDHFTNGLKLGYAYPNPANDKVSVRYATQHPGKLSFRLVDNTGRVIMEKNLENNTAGEHRMTLNTTRLKAGHYYMVLNNGKESLTKRLVISH